MSSSSSSIDLRNRILFTIGILAVYRFGTFVPLPGIDPEQLKILMESNQKGLLGMFNVFAGGAVSRMAIFALGIMPYISSAIIVQLLTGVSDYFKNLKAQGETGRAKITQITRYGTVLLATVQGYGLSVFFKVLELHFTKTHFFCTIVYYSSNTIHVSVIRVSFQVTAKPTPMSGPTGPPHCVLRSK
jgi:preprotein translocase subunit SecY